ncbi:hypothetical protein ACH5RR_010286 [Cinchona calisaya]|uniref:non-specific serine/threonine protein kinase n=1 Tax=Cinchona calisaya TaxID=153742 RepID=A0ABD3AGZ8_9GENT
MSEVQVTQTSSAGQSRSSLLFNKYELEKLLGCGSFAKVYQAKNIKNGQNVAIKVINKQKLPSTTSSVSNVKRELFILRRVHRHPNIVRLHEVLATKTKICLVMELAKRGDLSRKMSKGRFTEDLSRRCFQQLISAVGYCHLYAVYHRDLKPENVLIDDNGDLKVTDFGLSATINQVGSDGLLRTICGTPAYIAPEILIKKGYDGAKVDIWSCGVILFEMAAGFLPFNDTNSNGLYQKILKGNYTCPQWMSPQLKRLLSRLLDTNPTTRITIDEIKKDPWFKIGYEEDNYFYEEDLFSDFNDENKVIKNVDRMIHGPLSLNAFDLISFSPGLDLSGFFNASCGSMENTVRLVVEKSAKEIMEKLSEAAMEVENARLKRKKQWGVELHGHRASGKFVIELEVFRLTDHLLVVEAKRRAGAAGFFHELWEKKFLPSLNSYPANQCHSLAEKQAV